MTRLLRLAGRLADLALHAVAGFAAACLTTDEPDPTLRLDARVAELEKAMAEADWVMWREEMAE